MPWTSYGYNAWGSGGNYANLGLGRFIPQVKIPERPSVTEATRESEVRVPSDMIAFADGFNRSPNPAWDGGQGGGLPQLFGPNRGIINSETPPKQQASFKNHRGRFNQVFCDGHLEVDDMNDQFIQTDAYMKRWNKDNEPHREFWDFGILGF